ncbi:MAG: FAD-dependent oxidoreductase [Desulfobacterales bacterium]
MENQKPNQKNNKLLIIGGGVGGIRAALDLAEAGRDVVLIDRSVSIGGLMTQLDRTFPTNNCDLCTLSPNLSENGRQHHIELLTMTELTKLEGEVGNFKVTLTTHPRYIDLEKCTACGDCYEQFKECVRFQPGLDHRAPTCMRYPQATPQAYSIDMDKCNNIDGLLKVCKSGAIVPDDTERIKTIEVGAIVLATGAELFDPSVLDNFGGGTYPNVITGLEYERIMSASGPTLGSLVRPSDGKQPQKVAWIQCVGSRGINKADVPYCSGVCCMVALKEAIVTKERFQDDIDTTIFYMDMRTSGKDYERYRNRAENEYNVKLIRSRPHTITEDPVTKNLLISYALEEGSTNVTETYDMVVLSTGFRPSDEMTALSKELGIELNFHRFAQTSGFSPVETSRPGIYACGIFESPKDIPETMVQASAAACMASGSLDNLGNMPVPEEEVIPEKDVMDQEPKIGVFICDCGFNIGGVIDVEEIEAFARVLPNVAISEVVGHGCSRESMLRIQSSVEKHKLNRVVIGGCSPRTHEAKFQDLIRRAGLNKYLLEMANLRDQNTWVHKHNPDLATKKAKDLIRMAVFSVALRHPLTDHLLPVNKDILVVGGGVSGMSSALSLAEQGFKVYLVEQAATLGGLSKKVNRTLTGDNVQEYLQDLIEKTVKHERIEVLTGTTIVDHKGMPGMFTTGVQVAPRMYYRQIKHGAVIIATGAVPNRPEEYLLDEHEAVMTQMELDSVLENHPERVNAWDYIVMIQCVGSRTPENPNCSRICCQTAIKNALRIKENHPESQIFVLNRDIRTYGFQEDYYRKAREKGVIFVRYEADAKPLVKEDGKKVAVAFRDPILEQQIEISADCLVLSTGLIADDEATEDLAMIFHLNRTDDGFFLENHVKLRPVDLNVPGFMVAGTAHSPKDIRESIAQAQAAAGRALTFLAKETINLGAGVAKVDGKKCAACLICVRACPYDIPFINAEGYSEIDPAQCHGCGVCAAECPAKAIQLMQYEDDMISAELNGLLERIL